MSVAKPIVIMGIFVVDLAFETGRLPAWGETVLGSAFRLGPGGKGSNQAIGAARLGGRVSFISRVGKDTFGEMGLRMYEAEGVNTEFVIVDGERATGAAAILIEAGKGENAIVVTPGAASALRTEDVDRARGRIAESAVFMTQLELPVAVVEHGLRVARECGVATVLNPAPACALEDAVFELCDYVTPNENEAAMLTGLPVASMEDAERAATALLGRGAKNVVVTLGARGALVKTAEITEHVAAYDAGPVVDTTGAGDAFNAGLAVGLSEGMDLVRAVRFGCAVAGISVTRPGTAPSMPQRDEVERLMGK
ncbi:MAG TPA: ribokinase [Acidobacteriaceae bacterium]|nr:ribokinase [Acidobacteriaceae bacterium]